MEFAALIPELYVSDYKKSLSFYVDLIGFSVEYTRTSPLFAFLSFGDAQLMLQQVEPTDHHTGTLEYPFGRGTNFEIYVNDVDALAQRFRDAGVELLMEPTNFARETGEVVSESRELRVLDPDGYYLRFSC